MPIELTGVHEDTFQYNSLLMECLNSFFEWHNPAISFFEQEDFTNNMACTKQTGGMIAVVHAAGAMGALTAQRNEAQKMSHIYLQIAEKHLSLQHVQPEESAVEASLLCAMYFAGQSDFCKSRLYYGTRTHIICCQFADKEVDLAVSLFAAIEPIASSSPLRGHAKARGTSAGVNHRSRMLLNLYQSDKSPETSQKVKPLLTQN